MQWFFNLKISSIWYYKNSYKFDLNINIIWVVITKKCYIYTYENEDVLKSLIVKGHEMGDLIPGE